MAVEWTIVGEAGKAVDETAHTLADLQAEGASIEFNSLEADRMSWSIWLRSFDDAAVVVPDAGQLLTVMRNGVRFFTGIVTVREPDFSDTRFGYNITVENAWWWLRQIFLSSEVPDQNGTVAERTAYVFATGSPRAHLIALIARAIALGAPISEGSIASCFSVPRLSLRNIPFSESISEIIRWVADGIVYFDYAAVGHPALSMQRRTPATIVTLDLASAIVPRIRIKPRFDLQVEEVKVFFARRETVDGKRLTVWDSQVAGAVASGLPVRQPVMVSGPEKVYDILPQDFTDSVTVQSALIDVGDIIERYDERLRATGAEGFSVGTFTEETSTGGSFTLPAITTQITDADGNAIDAAYARYLTLGEPRDWWVKDGIEHVQARVAATIYQRVQYEIPGAATVPGWYEVLGGQIYDYTVDTGDGLQGVAVFATTASVSVPLVKTAWATPTLLIRAEDYAFVNPPEDLAANLLATQYWTPYEGSVSYVTEDIAAGHHVGKVLNIASFLPEAANMKALITRHEVRLATGENFLTIGAPDRYAYRDLVNRFRQNGADNIEWLVESVSGDAGDNPPPDPELEIPDYPEGTTVGEDGQPELTEDGLYQEDEDAP